MSLAPGACAGISAESEAGSPLGGPSAPKRGTFQADWRFTTPPARRVKSEIQSAGYARRRRLFTRLRTRVQFPPSPPFREAARPSGFSAFEALVDGASDRD